MKQRIKGFAKGLIILLGIILTVGAVIIGVYAVKGFIMYSNASAEVPVSDMASDIKSRNEFSSYEDLPEFYVNAVISTEDRRFFEHSGVDITAICRAAIHDIKTRSFEQGGSTITQQIAKNYYFTQEKKPERKFAEIFMALEIEKNYDKREIFEMYVNSIYFGSGYYGINAAAEGYFGKTPSQLTEYECAMLAGLPNAPSAYSPDENPQLAEERLIQVLDAMVSCNKIDDNKKEEILS